MRTYLAIFAVTQIAQCIRLKQNSLLAQED